MADRYAYARQRTAARLAQFSTGNVTLTRITRGAPLPETPSTPGPVTRTDVYTLDARVDGVAAELVDGTEIVATDRMVIASPTARLAGVATDLVPQMGDTLTIDGRPVTIKKIQAVPASGQAVRFHIFVGS